MIYRLINRGTIEERMMQLTKKKMVLEHLVVGKLKTQNINQVYFYCLKVPFHMISNFSTDWSWKVEIPRRKPLVISVKLKDKNIREKGTIFVDCLSLSIYLFCFPDCNLGRVR